MVSVLLWWCLTPIVSVSLCLSLSLSREIKGRRFTVGGRWTVVETEENSLSHTKVRKLLIAHDREHLWLNVINSQGCITTIKNNALQNVYILMLKNDQYTRYKASCKYSAISSMFACVAPTQPITLVKSQCFMVMFCVIKYVQVFWFISHSVIIIAAEITVDKL